MPFLASLVFFWLPMPPAFACINDYDPNREVIFASQGLAEDLKHVVLREPWTARRDRLRRAVEAGGDYKQKNDYAGALMHTGDPKAAIQILEAIERTNPGLYQTASNLGTAYELAGDNKKALEWIRKGIQRNPKSHESSEWIHVRILEAKIALSQGLDWESEGSILGLGFAHNPKPKPPASLPAGNSGEPLSLGQVRSGLKYQLRERLQFVKAPDPIVASLLLDLGNIIAVESGGFGLAQGMYELAASYAKSEEKNSRHVRDLISARHRAALQSIPPPPPSVGDRIWIVLAIFAVTVCYLLWKIRDLARCW